MAPPQRPAARAATHRIDRYTLCTLTWLRLPGGGAPVHVGLWPGNWISTSCSSPVDVHINRCQFARPMQIPMEGLKKLEFYIERHNSTAPVLTSPYPNMMDVWPHILFNRIKGYFVQSHKRTWSPLGPHWYKISALIARPAIQTSLSPWLDVKEAMFCRVWVWAD